MSIKRRGFLQMLGGAFAAPLVPSASLGAATKAAYPASALHAAIYHSQSRVSFSVFTLAQQLGLQLGQAEQLMKDMSKRGILGPLQGRTQAGRWAQSKVWIRPSNSVVATRTAAAARQSAASAEAASKPAVSDVVKHIDTAELTPPDLRTELSNVDNACCTDCGHEQS
ncbi:hypothetical protein SAMN05444287_2430 [Octadecabacter temperatus]|uniref:Uncharacterized protein n=1 Tax=Octadecabacter temperatus TaxID=1458307 RepID=A0A0K0Y191_9RHOB|nr:hypothetical protein [Octadecabacter temperatus]AKS44656.1 hypothetical protein OSB_00870 [Octadecabacter temperatus]SIO36899.1 hypothetical protein SAMN05444287_2430 [Octadecabacter temperatus]